MAIPKDARADSALFWANRPAQSAMEKLCSKKKGDIVLFFADRY